RSSRLAATVALGTLAFLTPAVRAGTSNSLLDLSADGTLLLVANADNGSVTVVDTAARQALREIKVGDKPEGVTFLGKPSLAAVTLYRDNQVVFFAPLTGAILQKLPVAPEPYGIVADAGGRRAWVTHEYPGLVSEIDVAERKVVRELKAGAFLRGLALSPDEQRLYVTEFYSGILLALDLATG